MLIVHPCRFPKVTLGTDHAFVSVLLLVLAGIRPLDSSESCWSLAKSKRSF